MATAENDFDLLRVSQIDSKELKNVKTKNFNLEDLGMSADKLEKSGYSMDVKESTPGCYK